MRIKAQHDALSTSGVQIELRMPSGVEEDFHDRDEDSAADGDDDDEPAEENVISPGVLGVVDNIDEEELVEAVSPTTQGANTDQLGHNEELTGSFCKDVRENATAVQRLCNTAKLQEWLDDLGGKVKIIFGFYQAFLRLLSLFF